MVNVPQAVSVLNENGTTVLVVTPEYPSYDELYSQTAQAKAWVRGDLEQHEALLARIAHESVMAAYFAGTLGSEKTAEGFVTFDANFALSDVANANDWRKDLASKIVLTRSMQAKTLQETGMAAAAAPAGLLMAATRVVIGLGVTAAFAWVANHVSDVIGQTVSQNEQSANAAKTLEKGQDDIVRLAQKQVDIDKAAGAPQPPSAALLAAIKALGDFQSNYAKAQAETQNKKLPGALPEWVLPVGLVATGGLVAWLIARKGK